MFRRIVLGVSGGIDSAVSGYILKKHGFEVTGVFMRNWDIKDEFGRCSADKELSDAKWICKKLDIPLYEVNFVQEYWNEVFRYLLEEYENGRTPNPDVCCNRYIKFAHFFEFVEDKYNADAIATGHYAQSSFGSLLQHYNDEKNCKLLKSSDKFKDQTLFLSQIPQKALRKTMFPVGHLSKQKVREIAYEAGLGKLLEKDESTGICFIGKRNFQSFISQYIPDKPGNFVDCDNGKVVAQHNGLHNWTLGQKTGIPGYAWKYYTLSKDVQNNVIFVTRGGSDLRQFSDSVVVENFRWIDRIPELLSNGQTLNCQFRFQHTKPLINCRVKLLETSSNLENDKDAPSITSAGSIISNDCASVSREDLFSIELETPLRALTPGQFAVLYSGEECLGSGTICRIGASAYEKYVERKKL